MHPAALVLVVAAAAAHAGWNLCAKRVPDGGAVFVWLYAAVASAVCIPAAAAVAAVSRQAPAAAWLPAVLVSGALHTSYFVLLQRGYAVGDLSVVYPLARGSGPLLTVVAAVLLFGERPGVLPLVGAALVVAGIAVVGGIGAGRTAVRAHVSTAVWYGLATGVLIAAYTLWDAYAVTDLDVPPLVLMAGAMLCQTVLLTPLARAQSERVAGLWRSHRVSVLAIAVLSPLAYIMVLFAMRLAPVSLVAPARELSVVFGGVGGWLLLHEPHPVRRLTGAAIVLAGVAAIAVRGG